MYFVGAVEAHAKQSKAKQMPLKDMMTSGNNKAELIQCHTLIVIELTDAYSYPRPRQISASATKCIHTSMGKQVNIYNGGAIVVEVQ